MYLALQKTIVMMLRGTFSGVAFFLVAYIDYNFLLIFEVQWIPGIHVAWGLQQLKKLKYTSTSDVLYFSGSHTANRQQGM